MAAIEGGYVSADGHFVEPADLWVKRMDKRFRDRAPRVEARADADWYVIDGVTPFPVGLEGASMEDKIGAGIKMMGGHRHADTRPGAWDPQARLADLTLDHIKAEVMYPGGFGLQFWAAPDPVYQAECCRVYNDWVSEFCSSDPGRFLGAALIPMRGPIELAVKETQRAAKLKGIKTLSIPTTMVDRHYSSPEYEPLWAAIALEFALPGNTSFIVQPSLFTTFGWQKSIVSSGFGGATAGNEWNLLPVVYLEHPFRFTRDRLRASVTVFPFFGAPGRHYEGTKSKLVVSYKFSRFITGRLIYTTYDGGGRDGAFGQYDKWDNIGWEVSYEF